MAICGRGVNRKSGPFRPWNCHSLDTESYGRELCCVCTRVWVWGVWPGVHSPNAVQDGVWVEDWEGDM